MKSYRVFLTNGDEKVIKAESIIVSKETPGCVVLTDGAYPLAVFTLTGLVAVVAEDSMDAGEDAD